jgi:hypothetical protein
VWHLGAATNVQHDRHAVFARLFRKMHKTDTCAPQAAVANPNQSATAHQILDDQVPENRRSDPKG